MKKWLTSSIKNIEKANEKNFGNTKMDCCDLNQKSNQPNTSKKYNH